MKPQRFWARLALGVVLFAYVLLGGVAPAFADSSAQSLPFAQDWSNTSLITTDDNWSGVPGITGYRGDGLVSTTGVDPQTVLVDGTSTPVDVNANQTNPNTFTTGGVTEFHLTDPVVALAGSGTARAPFLLINLNTTGYESIRVMYNLRDLESGADNAIQPIALHYRVGNSGNFTNVPAAFVADATDGPNIGGRVTSVDVVLPAAVNSQPLVQIRIMTTDAGGSDEWVGIDDIQISGTPLSGDLAPYVAASTPANGASGVALDANLQVTFSEPVTLSDPWFSLSCNRSGTHTAVVTGGPTEYTLNPDVDFVYSESCTLTVTASAVADQDEPIQTMSADFTATFATTAPSLVCGEPYIPINAIQGSGLTSPYQNSTVTTEGVVAAVFQGTGKLGGFFLNSLNSAIDSNPATSEGIFVYAPSASINVGDRVRVSGTAQEYSGSYGAMAQMTQIGDSPTVNVCSSGETVTPFPLILPLPAEADPQTYLERYEGMLVTISQPLTVQQNYFLGRFGQLTLGTGGRIFTHLNSGTGSYADNLRRMIVLDDGATAQNPAPIPYYASDGAVRAGDVIPTLTGVVDQGRVNSSNTGTVFPDVFYRIHPTLAPTFESQNPRLPTPPLVGTGMNGTVKVAAMNVLNYFVTLNQTPYPAGSPYNASNTPRGANTATEFTRQQDKIVRALAGLNADVVGLIEIESWTGADAVNNLVSALNTYLGSPVYAAVPDPATGVGGDAIKVALIYKTATVERVGDSLSTSASPFNLYRYPVAQAFRDKTTGEVFTVVVNHFKSKSCSGTPTGGDVDLGEGVGCYNATRVAMSNALLNWINTTLIPTTGDPDVVVMGDFNAYGAEQPILTLESGGLVNTGKQYEGVDTYSYVFDGMAGALDHLFVTSSLSARVSGAGHWHINADEPSVIDYNTEFKTVDLYQPHPYRSSDHDPILVGLDFRSYGVSLLPDNDARSGAVNSTVTYTLTLRNTGNMSDTYTFTSELLSGENWSVTLPDPVTLAGGASRDVTVQVSIPATASIGQTSQIRVTATSQFTSAISASSTLTTSVGTSYGVTLAPTSDAKNGFPGDTVTFTLALRNTGNMSDTFNFSSELLSGENWSVILPDPVTLAAGASQDVTVQVSIPATASGGQTSQIRVTATSQANTGTSASSTLTTTAQSLGVNFIPTTDEKTGRPGVTLTYILTLENSGTVADTYTLSAIYQSGETWAPTLSDSEVTLNAGATRTITVTVTVPANLLQTRQSVYRIRAVSQTRSLVVAESTLTSRGEPYTLFMPLIIR
ncbi:MULTISPECIES: ExeM/NucH family extracellular endonuclease [Anaerolinea]|uniref:ExeM/NucH family extracellular endonuclease n=1 Tax=Anaerolinea TaxID=233189 RepID=UPI002634CEDA|nr:ExeM/NucH family extracellular endonuclease [Anaerolinea thermophila]